MGFVEQTARIAAAAAALVVALGVLHRFGLGAWRTARRIEDMHTHVARIPSIEAHGIETRMIVDQLAVLVSKELRPNGGSSLYDKVTKVEQRSRVIERREES